MSFHEGNLHERTELLEALARDMWESLNTVSEAWAEDLYAERMAALGLLEEDDEEEE